MKQTIVTFFILFNVSVHSKDVGGISAIQCYFYVIPACLTRCKEVEWDISAKI